MPAVLAEEVVELMASGVDVYVATRDETLEPEAVFAMGIRAHDDRSLVTVYVPSQFAGPTRKNLEANGAIAVTIERPGDARAVQIKGRSIAIRDANDGDRAFQSVFRSALVEQLATVGVPRCTTRRLVWWPSLAVDVEISDVFVQTPGPKAGEPMPR
jgi:hypothetical protein